MERMFMQIFERKDWIAAQLRQQVDSYAQSIASNMLAAGVDVPSCLWSAAAVPDLWNSRLQLGLNKEKMVPGVHYNLPHFTTPMNYATYPPTFHNDKRNLGVHNILHESNPDKDGETCVVADSYDRMQDSFLEHKNKKIKHCDAKKNAVEYSGRMTRSKAGTLMARHKNDDHLTKQKRTIEYSDRVIRSKMKASTNTQKNDYQLRSQRSVIQCSRRVTKSEMTNTVKIEKNDDQLRNQESGIGCSRRIRRSEVMESLNTEKNNHHSINLSGIECSGRMTRLKVSSLKNLNIKVPLELKNLTGGEFNRSQNQEDSSAIWSKSVPSNEGTRSSFILFNESDTPSKIFQQIQEPHLKEDEMDLGVSHDRSPPAQVLMAQEEILVGSPWPRNHSAGLHSSNTCLVAEEEEMVMGSLDHRNPSVEKYQETEKGEEMEVARLCDANPARESHQRKECETVKIDCLQKVTGLPNSSLLDAFKVKTPVDISAVGKVNKATESVVDDDTQKSLQNGSYGVTAIQKVLEENKSNKKINSPSFLPTEHFSFSSDINREISEDKTPELEGFSVERPIMAESFTFDVPNLANFGLEGSSVAEMNDARRSFTSNKELSIAEDAKMICNESKKLEVLDKEFIPGEESLEFVNVQRTSKVGCIDSIAMKAEPNVDIISYSYDGREDAIATDTGPEFEAFNLENPILMTGLIFDDPDLQRLSRERSNALEQLQRSMNEQDLISPDVNHLSPNTDDTDTLESARSLTNEETQEISNVENIADVPKLPIEMDNAGDTYPRGFDQNRVDGYSVMRSFGSNPLHASSSQSGLCTPNPHFTLPVEKLPQKAFLERERIRSLLCFPIHENSKSLKETTDDTKIPIKREPLTDVSSSHQNRSSVTHLSEISNTKDLDKERKMSLRASEQKRSQTVLQKKSTNIVSNIQSFIPLVRQKQPTVAPAAGKREVKVKALEAADAARKLAEKKEIERKMKKEALKIERMKLEQENARQQELKHKQKEEERKKKEAGVAARKRQREEEMREKQKKKNCTEPVHRRAAEERESRKVEEASQDKEKMQPVRASSSSLLQNRQSESYEISPYRDSDDEELQEDKRRRKKKFVPSWVRRESLDGHLLSMREMDPKKIFTRKASFNISEVLPYRTRLHLS